MSRTEYAELYGKCIFSFAKKCQAFQIGYAILISTSNEWEFLCQCLVLLVKDRIDKLNFIKIKNFYSPKDIVKRMRREATDWRKYL